MGGWQQLARQYEQRNFPPTRRLDLQAEGPDTARSRALRWIQMWAHELPGAELLLVVDRVKGSRSRSSPVRRSIESLLDDISGGLIEWWQEFGEGSIALRIAAYPDISATRSVEPEPVDLAGDDGRTRETAGVAFPDAEDDIPPELLSLAERAAELRRAREGLSVGLLGVVLRQVWISAQAIAMTERLTFEGGLRRILATEERQAYARE